MLAAIRRAPHSAAELSIDAIKASASDSERNNYTYLCMKAKGYVLAKDLTKDCTVYALVGYVGSEIKEDCYRIPPYSARAQILAAIWIVVAAMARTVVGMAGSDQRFVTYYPAIMAASLLAGVPAGISVAVGATLITWLVLIPALMSRPTPAMDLFIFLISSGFIIIFAYCCRLVLNRLRQSELHQVTLTNELIHRGRNTFAVVEVIVQKTLLHHPRLAKALLGRIRSISRANDLISAAAHSGVHLRDLLIQEFEPFGINRLKTLGPNVRIPPLKVRYLILIFHELATNSAKYGSLSNSSGRVIVDWAIVEDVVTINWKEKGGRVVTPAEREGFGTKLIAQSAKSLSAKLSQQFSFDGFGCSLAFRVATDDALISKFRKNRRLYTFKRSESRDHYKGKFDLAVKLEEPQGAWRHGFRRYYSCAAIF